MVAAVGGTLKSAQKLDFKRFKFRIYITPSASSSAGTGTITNDKNNAVHKKKQKNAPPYFT